MLKVQLVRAWKEMRNKSLEPFHKVGLVSGEYHWYHRPVPLLFDTQVLEIKIVKFYYLRKFSLSTVIISDFKLVLPWSPTAKLVKGRQGGNLSDFITSLTGKSQMA